MLINCHSRCRKSGGTTDASLDLETDEVICNKCGDTIPGVSSFAKNTMKTNKDIVKPKKKAFVFPCLTCKKSVEVGIDDETPVGIGCKKECKFNISSFTINAMKSIGRKAEEEFDEES